MLVLLAVNQAVEVFCAEQSLTFSAIAVEAPHSHRRSKVLVYVEKRDQKVVRAESPRAGQVLQSRQRIKQATLQGDTSDRRRKKGLLSRHFAKTVGWIARF